MKISVLGLGYVGAVSMACLARDGHAVVGVDVDRQKLDMIRAGKAPIVEEGIQELMRQVVDAGRVSVTEDVAAAVAATDITFVCVGTPSSPNGSQDLAAVARSADAIGKALRGKGAFHSVVLRSTVQPGTVDGMFGPALERASGLRSGEGFGLAFQPEFLREGSSIRDYDRPPFTVVGTESERTAAALRELFGGLPAEFIVTSVAVAEMLKYACNAFHAVKITFANEIGRLGRASGVDGREVMALLCRDRQLNVSAAYLKPGFAFGGSCLPKDLRALTYLGKSGDVTTPMLGAVLGSNRAHIDLAFDHIQACKSRRVGLAGLSFKPGTDDLRESPLVALAERLIGKGYELRILDPQVSLSHLIGANRRFIDETIPHIGSLMVSGVDELLAHAQVLVVGHASEELLAALRAGRAASAQLVDLVGLPRDGLQVAGYAGICW
jgi:GDP-mannose 6-dehydrogenase